MLQTGLKWMRKAGRSQIEQSLEFLICCEDDVELGWVNIYRFTSWRLNIEIVYALIFMFGERTK